MKQLLTFLFLISSFVAFGQFAPTSAKTKFVNGIAIGSKDTSAYSASDTIVLTIARDSVMYYKYKGFWRPIAVGGSTSAYKLISDTLFNNGYTTRGTTKKVIDSLAAIELNISDTAAMLANRLKISDTATMLSARPLNNRFTDSIAVIRALANTKGSGNGTVTSIATNNGSGITGGTITTSGTIAADTTVLSTKANVTASLLPKVNYTDTASMLARSPLVNRFLDSVSIIRALANTKGVGTVTGSGTSGQVGYWNGTSSMTGSSNLFWDNTNGRLGIGTTSPLYDLSIYQNSGNALYNMRAASASGGRAILFFQGARGTLASPTASAVSDAIGEFVGSGYANSAFQNVAAMTFQIDPNGTVSSSSLPSDIYFETTPNGSLTRARVGTIKSSGRLLWNTSTDNGVDIGQFNGSIIATTLKGTTATISGNATVAGTLGVTGVATFNSNPIISTSGGTAQIRIKGASVITGFDVQNDVGGAYLWNRDATDMYFATNNTQRLNINGSTGAATFSNNVSVAGTLGVTGAQTNSSSIAATKIIGNSSTPSNALGSSTYVGTGASASISGNDMAGVITLTSGTGTATTGISERTGVTVTFASAYASAPVVVANIFSYDGSGNAIATTTLQVNPQNTTTSQFQVTIPNGTTLAASTTFRISYHVIGR